MIYPAPKVQCSSTQGQLPGALRMVYMPALHPNDSPRVFSSRLVTRSPLRELPCSAMQLMRLYWRASRTSMRVFSAARASLEACHTPHRNTTTLLDCQRNTRAST